MFHLSSPSLIIINQALVAAERMQRTVLSVQLAQQEEELALAKEALDAANAQHSSAQAEHQRFLDMSETLRAAIAAGEEREHAAKLALR